jgi:hypothetical protein
MAGIIEVKDQGKVRIYDADNSNYVDIVVPSTVSSNRTITIPDATFTIPQETNATHTGEVTGSGALTIADNVVDEANLKVSNSPTNGYALTAQSGNTGGLTWAAAGLDGWSSNSGNLLPADASKGIYLGVNSATAANLLDDYEEGIWSPVINGSTFTDAGFYSKVGRICLVQFGNQTGNAIALTNGSYYSISGLPFSIIAGGWQYASTPSLSFADSSSSYRSYPLTGRQENTGSVHVANRSGIDVATNDPLNFAMVYATN